MSGRRLLSLALACTLAASSAADEPFVFRLRSGAFEASPGAPRAALSVGSLQKPFVAQAWAATHPGETPPRFTCVGAACWYRPGHATLGLVGATSLSCNSYFRSLAAQVPGVALAETLRRAGFRVEAPLSPDEAIGLDPGQRVAITPEALLAAYLRLVREPWASGESVRRDVLAGLRQAAFSGTASPLRERGVWAKTGTSAAISGAPLATSGWVVAVDDAALATLALVPLGTGRSAAQALARLGPAGSAPHPRGTDATDSVTVELFSLFAPREIVARNMGDAPIAAASGFIGPGGERRLRGGDRLERGVWRLRLPGRGFERVVAGSVACDGRADGTLRVRVTLTRREYAAGVVAAELPDGSPSLQRALAAAALRFLATGPRHAGADVCDTTHCAWFVGRAASPALGDAAWAEVLAEAARPGPSQWTSHCGGDPLSPHYVWGTGDRSAPRCPFHEAGETRAWSRVLSDADVAKAFGAGVRALRVVDQGGVWNLEVEGSAGVERMLYDEAHRRLAATGLGWGALPSPATRIVRANGGFRAEGVGLGHRVGLCLGEARDYANIAGAWLPLKHP